MHNSSCTASARHNFYGLLAIYLIFEVPLVSNDESGGALKFIPLILSQKDNIVGLIHLTFVRHLGV